ncbi:hypothetical protein Hanom_Chr04g00357231 [Helianthus anomalus]
MRFGNFCHFSAKLKLFVSGSLWFQFCCHFGPKIKSGHICHKILQFCSFSQGQIRSYLSDKIWYLFIKKMIILPLRKMTN